MLSVQCQNTETALMDEHWTYKYYSCACLLVTVGWKNTYDVYYSSYTKDVLNLMLEYLTMNSNLTFVWPEVVFLQQWYNELTQGKQDDFRKFVLICLLSAE